MFDWFFGLFNDQIIGYVVTTVVTVILGWIAVLYQRITGRQLEAAHRAALQSALENGLKWAIQQVLDGKLQKDGTVPESAKASVIASARKYVIGSVPDALRHFEVSDEKLTDLLVPKLPIANRVPESLVSK